MTDRDDLSPVPPFGLTGRRLRLWLTVLGLALVLAYLWRSIFIPIGPGQLGVRWSRFGGGTVDAVYGEGYPAIWPWDRMALYDTRLQDLSGALPVLTRDGLSVTLTVTARFAPQRAALVQLHQAIGPHYRDVAVWPDVVAAVRQVVRQFKSQDLQVVGEAGLAEQIDGAARAAVERHWVTLDRVLVTGIALPPTLAGAIEDKLAEEQKLLTMAFTLKRAELDGEKRKIKAAAIHAFETLSGISILKWRGLEVTEKLAASPNAKVVVMGSGDAALPLLLNGDK